MQSIIICLLFGAVSMAIIVIVTKRRNSGKQKSDAKKRQDFSSIREALDAQDIINKM